MKKLLLLAAFAVLALVDYAAILSPTQTATLYKRRAVSRELVDIDGKQCVIVHYKRGAEYDGATTNVVRSINAVKQNNPLQDEIAAKVAELKTAVQSLNEEKDLHERLRARCVRKRDYYLDLEQKAVLKTSKELWRAIADANQDIIDYLDGKVDDND